MKKFRVQQTAVMTIEAETEEEAREHFLTWKDSDGATDGAQFETSIEEVDNGAKKAPHQTMSDRFNEWIGDQGITATQLKWIVWGLARDHDLNEDFQKEVARETRAVRKEMESREEE